MLRAVFGRKPVGYTFVVRCILLPENRSIAQTKDDS